jgi:lipoic acid synthetase
MQLDYVVLTSVTRDDLPDGGAEHFAKTIQAIREILPKAGVEVLTPDFRGDVSSLRTVLDARPDVLNHNLETAAPLYPHVRPQASYERSLTLLDTAASYGQGIITKSGLMLGIGETDEDIFETFSDLASVNCRLLTLGQYLQPSKHHLPVHRFLPPDKFENLREIALKSGFRKVTSGPFVRSSYHAGEMHMS